MVLRAEALRARLLKLEEVISRLRELGASSRPPRRFRDEWAIERGLQLGAEIVLDVGNHVLSAHFGATARDYEDVIARLAEHGVVEEGLRKRLKGLGGFRNILVHDYLKLDAERVADHLARAPQDFEAFALAVRRWLDSLPPTST